MAVRALRQATAVDGTLQIAVVHGPNLNTLGRREPHIYGTQTLDDINARLLEIGAELGAELHFFQSNHEGALVDHIQGLHERCHGLVINAAAYTHTSIAIRDAIAALGVPTVEVHLTNVFTRESFRQESMIGAVVKGVVAGFGPLSYELALIALAQQLRR